MSYIAPRDPEITPSRLIPIALSLLVPVLMLTAFPAGAATKAEVYGHAKASTVLVVAIDDKSQSVSLGSGFLVNADGLVITNAHVIEDNSRLLVVCGQRGGVYESDGPRR